MGARRAVFLDRDGTINEEVAYLADPARFRLLPGAAEALARLAAAGFLLAVVTNQAGVARGLFGLDTLEAIHRRMREELAAAGVALAAVRYCPHHPEHGVGAFRIDCACRKPKPGMILDLAAELGVDLAGSFMIGDKAADVEAGLRAGCRAILVRTGYGRGEERQCDPRAVVRDDLAAAAEWILCGAAQPTGMLPRA